MSIASSTNRSDKTISGRWQLDPRRSSVEFRGKKFWGLVSVTGHFGDYHGELDLSADPAIELTIDARSLQTGLRKRDRHLRSDAFFDVENHPFVRFVSDAVEPHGDTLTVRGRLSARGRSIPLELDAAIRQVGGALEIAADTTASHRELGMTWSPLGMILPRSRLSVRAHLVPDADKLA